MKNIILAILVLLSLFSLTGAIIYKIYSLNNIGILFAVAITIFIFSLLIKYNFFTKDNQKKDTIKNLNLYWLLAYILFFTSSLVFVLQFSSDQSITSPWELIHPLFFLFYFLTSLALIINIIKKSKLSLLLLSLHSLLTFSIIFIIYKIGYGYDSFIHEASIRLIDKNGAIDPKPIYYLGQYSLLIIIHKITGLSLVLLNKVLVPVLAFIFLPYIIYDGLQNFLSDKTKILLAGICLYALPFSFLTFTTPQNLAYLFFIITIFYALSIKQASNDKKNLIIIYIFALTTFFVHPIAGIPALIFASALTIYKFPFKKISTILYVALFLLSTTILPFLFYLNNQDNFSPQQIVPAQLFKIPSLSIPYQENFILNFVYLIKFNSAFIILLLALVSVVYFYKQRKKYQTMLINIGISFSLLLSYFLTKMLSFDFLIEYERDDYANRILIIAVLALLPLFGIIFYELIKRSRQQNRIVKSSLLVFLTLLITTSMYTSYPRKDDFFNSHGLSVSGSDIKAVNWIENDAQGDDYAVLANQQVSVAALRQFGFRYLNNDMYFYPIPTGGELYQSYLKMVYQEAGRKQAEEAMSLTETEAIYFVLNKYWWAFDKILAEAKFSADSFTEIDNGKVYIFKYLK